MTIRNVLVFLFAFLNAQVTMGECKQLDDKKLEELLIPASIQVMPGRTFRIRTFLQECCVIETDLNDVCATWSMDATKGVHLNSETGELSINNDVTAGSTFTVTANVQNGQKILTSKITVYTPQQNPFVGRWKEAVQVDCATGEVFSPTSKIEEIEFQADGQFFVTWLPFELYRDYWGTYTFDLKKGVFTLSGLSGNYVPEDVDHGGTFTFPSERSLILKDFWFGTPNSGETKVVVKKACGHHLFR